LNPHAAPLDGPHFKLTHYQGGIGLEVTGSGVDVGDFVIAATDVSRFRFASVQFTGSTGFSDGVVVTFEASNDNSNWVATAALRSTGAAAPATTANAVGIYLVPLTAKWFRVRVTTGGDLSAVSGRAEFSALPLTLPHALTVTANQGSAGGSAWPLPINRLSG
jgi:hypothetical protein